MWCLPTCETQYGYSSVAECYNHLWTFKNSIYAEVPPRDSDLIDQGWGLDAGILKAFRTILVGSWGWEPRDHEGADPGSQGGTGQSPSVKIKNHWGWSCDPSAWILDKSSKTLTVVPFALSLKPQPQTAPLLSLFLFLDLSSINLPKFLNFLEAI